MSPASLSIPTQQTNLELDGCCLQGGLSMSSLWTLFLPGVTNSLQPHTCPPSSLTISCCNTHQFYKSEKQWFY